MIALFPSKKFTKIAQSKLLILSSGPLYYSINLTDIVDPKGQVDKISQNVAEDIASIKCLCIPSVRCLTFLFDYIHHAYKTHPSSLRGGGESQVLVSGISCIQ